MVLGILCLPTPTGLVPDRENRRAVVHDQPNMNLRKKRKNPQGTASTLHGAGERLGHKIFLPPSQSGGGRGFFLFGLSPFIGNGGVYPSHGGVNWETNLGSRFGPGTNRGVLEGARQWGPRPPNTPLGVWDLRGCWDLERDYRASMVRPLGPLAFPKWCLPGFPLNENQKGLGEARSPQ